MKRRRKLTFIPSPRMFDHYGRSAWLVYGMKKSRNFGNVRGCRHTFRLLDAKGKIRYRGYCVFPKEANYNAIIAPLVCFGKYHGCCGIAYKAQGGYRMIPMREATAFQEAQYLFYRDPIEFLDMYDLHDLTEADGEQIRHYLEYITQP